MSNRRSIIVLLLALLVVLPAAAKNDWTVTSRDGSVYHGTLVRLVEGLYVLQSDGALIELSEDDIDPRTFKDRSRSDTKPKEKLSVANHYVELHEDGTATNYISFTNHNTGSRAITEYRYGLAPWEQREVDQHFQFDGFGNLLQPTFDPPREKWEPNWDRNVSISFRLPIPVAPGEYWQMASRSTFRAHFEKVEGGFAWSHFGDYAEDRVVCLKVRLPKGAPLLEATPEPSATFADSGFEYVMWRQYYHKGERRALRVVFGSR